MKSLGRRNLRWLLSALTLLSLLLAVIVVALWVRSYWANDWWNKSANAGISASSNKGRVSLVYWWPLPAYRTTITSSIRTDMGDLFPSRTQEWALPGIGLQQTWFAAGPTPAAPFYKGFVVLWLGHWLLALLFAILPTIWLFTVIRRRSRPAAGCCTRCSYDLRGSEASAACPECGEPISAGVPVSEAPRPPTLQPQNDSPSARL